MSDPSQTPDPEQVVEDPGEYNQRLRLQEIAQARKNARRALGGEAQQAYGPDWEAVALREVQNLAREIEWLVRDRGAQEYFTTQLGPITIGPPTKENFPKNISVKEVIGDLPEEVNIPVNGLYSTQETGRGFTDLPPTVGNSWSLKVTTRHKGPQEVSVPLERSIPITVVTKADSLCRRFINEAGLDARLENSRPHTEY